MNRFNLKQAVLAAILAAAAATAGAAENNYKLSDFTANLDAKLRNLQYLLHNLDDKALSQPQVEAIKQLQTGVEEARLLAKESRFFLNECN